MERFDFNSKQLSDTFCLFLFYGHSILLAFSFYSGLSVFRLIQLNYRKIVIKENFYVIWCFRTVLNILFVNSFSTYLSYQPLKYKNLHIGQVPWNLLLDYSHYSNEILVNCFVVSGHRDALVNAGKLYFKFALLKRVTSK